MGNVHGVDGPEAMRPPISNVLQASLHGGGAEGWGGNTVDPNKVGNTPFTKGEHTLIEPSLVGRAIGDNPTTPEPPLTQIQFSVKRRTHFPPIFGFAIWQAYSGRVIRSGSQGRLRKFWGC